MLAELARRADERAQLVLSGRASEHERDLPFWVFVDALDEYVQGLEPRRLDSLPDDVRAELAHVLPSLSGLAASRGRALQDERYRTHRAVRDLLELLASTRPLVLVLDDLHWADPGSVELLSALLRRPPTSGVLIALAVRPQQLPERLSAALERAHRSGSLERLELRALTGAETRALLGEAADDSTATMLYEESGGNPFYLEQLARSVARAGEAIPARAEVTLSDLQVPPAVAAALTEEIALLSEGARRVFEGAAVAGDPFDPELAAAGAGMPEASTVEALDELLALDLVRLTDVPRRFCFRHPLVRRAGYEATPAGWRLGAHERSAAALAKRGASAAACAHDLARSARHGDRAAVAVLREAGASAAQRAPASAARWFDAALRLLPDAALAEERCELLLARAGALAATGQFADSHAALLESMDLVPRESVAFRVRLTVACAGVEHLLGRHAQAHTRLASALDHIADPSSPEAVALMMELAVDSFVRMDYGAMREWAAQALSAARLVGDRPLTAAGVSALALADACAGAIPEAQAHRSEAADLVDAMLDEELARRLDAAVNLANSELYLHRYEEASTHADRALALARATGQGELFPVLFPLVGTVALGRGRVLEAAELLEGAVEAARLSGNVQGLAANLLCRSQAALAVGDVETALATAEESVALTRELDESLVLAWAGAALGAALLQSGAPTRAIEVLTSCAGGDDLRLIPAGWRPYCLEVLTRCWLALGHHGEAERAASRAESSAATTGLRLAVAMADRAAAAVALDAGEPSHAAERALTSAAAAAEVGAPMEAALSRTLAGRAFAQAGDHRRAVSELARAAEQLDGCGAVRYRAEAERELRKLGQRIHRRTRPGNASGTGIETLTERELQLARLVVDRKTNAEIAAELFLSQKTVESHLRNAFHKLGVSSRVELARAVEHAKHTQHRAVTTR